MGGRKDSIRASAGNAPDVAAEVVRVLPLLKITLDYIYVMYKDHTVRLRHPARIPL